MPKGYAFGHVLLKVGMQEFGAAYASLVPATLEPFGGKFVAKCPKPQAIATVGDTQMLSFIIEFPSSENAEKWYNSEAYQKIVPKRIEMADFHMAVCAGLE